jgi:carbohydrate-binding DOMON domain-containing protein
MPYFFPAYVELDGVYATPINYILKAPNFIPIGTGRFRGGGVDRWKVALYAAEHANPSVSIAGG